MTATKLFAKLMNMRNGAGKLAYVRLETATALLSDRGWVEDVSGGGGNYEAAIERLEEDVLADLCGGISLGALLDMFHHNQDIVKWRKYKFNLRKLWADWSAEQKGVRKAKKGERAKVSHKGFATPSTLQEMTPAQARNEYTRALSKLETSAEKIQRLEAENVSLKAEVVRLNSVLSGYQLAAKAMAKIA